MHKAALATFSFQKEDLLKTITLKLETTSNKYSDIFNITALANGNTPEETTKKPSKKLPKASFDSMAGFIGAM